MSWLAEARRAARARFERLGFPTTQSEEWRFTNVAALAGASFRTGAGDAPKIDSEYGDFECEEMVFADGRLVVGRSVAEGVEPGWLSIEPPEAADGFSALNLASFEDGALVQVPDGAVIEAPIHLVFVSTEGRASHPRNVIRLGRGAQATVIETYLGQGGLTNAVTDVHVGEGAVLRHVKLQREGAGTVHVSRVHASLGRAATFAGFSAALGGALSRSDTNVTFLDEGGECSLDGLYAGAGAQLHDSHTTVDHAAPRCSSRQLYKGVLDGESRGVFNGKVIVQKGAVKTNAHQTNKNLLLSRKALAHTKPELQIFCDDVKCSHGATVGQLDKLALFYLRSRGIGEVEGRRLLTYAFLSEVVERLPVASLRSWLDTRLMTEIAR